MGLFTGKAVTAADIRKSLDAFDGETSRMQGDLEAKKQTLTRALATGGDSAKLQREVQGLQLALDGRPSAKAALLREARRADRTAALASQRAEGAVVRRWLESQVAAGKKLAAAYEAFLSAVAAFRALGEARPANAVPDDGQAGHFFAALGLEELASGGLPRPRRRGCPREASYRAPAERRADHPGRHGDHRAPGRGPRRRRRAAAGDGGGS